VLALVALAVGCGGDDDGGGSATQDWANGVCEAVSTWSESIRSTADSLRSGATSPDALRDAVDEFADATQTFVDDLRGLGAPDTEAGDEAKAALDELSEDVDENIEEMNNAVEGASGVSGIVEAATSVSTTLAAMGQQLSSTFSELEGLDASGEIEDAFRDADSCDELTSEGS
jgi:methyl-accepting chemotaxis protein